MARYRVPAYRARSTGRRSNKLEEKMEERMDILKTAATASLVATTLGGAAYAEATEIRCSHQMPPKHHIAQVIDRWAEEVETLSGGSIDMQIFGANSLVGAKENIIATAKGDIECAFSIGPQWGKTLPVMNVTLAPFAFSDIEIWKDWPESEAAAFLEGKLRDKGVQNLVWLFTTNTSVFSSNGSFLLRPEDFQGVKSAV